MQSQDIFVHVRVLMGVVLGLGLTRMLTGIARFVQHPKQKPLYAGHLLWVGVVIVMTVHYWWFEFGLIRINPWTFELFVFVLGYAFLLYLMASLLIPDDLEGYASWSDYFMSRRGWFFGLLAMSAPVDFIDTAAKGPAYLHSLGPEYPIRMIGLVLICGLGAWVKDRRVQVAIAGLYLAYFVSWVLRIYHVLD